LARDAHNVFDESIATTAWKLKKKEIFYGVKGVDGSGEHQSKRYQTEEEEREGVATSWSRGWEEQDQDEGEAEEDGRRRRSKP